MEHQRMNDSSDEEQYEGGAAGNIVMDCLMRVRQKHNQDQNKWQDKKRFGHIPSKCKKNVKVEEKVKRQNIKAKIANYLGGVRVENYGKPDPFRAHSPNSRTLGLWVEQAKKSARGSRSPRGNGGSPNVKRSTLLQYAKAQNLPAPRYVEEPVYASEPVDITLTVPKKAVKKTQAKLAVTDALKPGKRMREVRSRSPRATNLNNSLYAPSSAKPKRTRSGGKKLTTSTFIQQPEMNFTRDAKQGPSGGIYTTPITNTHQTSFSTGKKSNSSWKKVSKNQANASYMQPTFSKNMLLARSGQISALVATTRQGRPVVVDTQRVASPNVVRPNVTDFSFAASPAGKKKRPTSVKKSMRPSTYDPSAPLSMSAMQKNFRVSNAKELSDQQVADMVVTSILTQSGQKRKSSPLGSKVIREATIVEDGPAEVYVKQDFNSSTNVAKRQQIANMEKDFENIQATLAQVRSQKNHDFYDDHNNNYYKGQLKRDQTRTSVKLIQDRNDAHLAEQYEDRVYGKKDLGFKVDSKVVKMSTKKPLDFVEKELARTSLK